TLEQLRHYDRALAVADHLLQEFQYEKIGPLRDRVANAVKPSTQKPSLPPPLPAHQEENINALPRNAGSFRIKPLRLVLLIVICALTYLGYIPLFLGIGIIVAYFVIKTLLSLAISRIFSAP